ncbi:transcriptional regulator [Streptomyces tateyamensis]|uniref:Transcriptional regulator n=1 Tax=Streptomyces tateyamensis TaxID=565073 RepID=A0A2V4PAA5_9ACTN|nr:XRE family transcriptional regulator [Streptomyces tateyamensis]PYC87989.1 transcriptional regulator [Streptomyces tateyamensis]
MTDLPAELTTGERIRHVRERRGMSRNVTAGLVGRSADWLKKIENGERELRGVTLLVKLAQVLHVDDVSVLTGDSVSIPTDQPGKVSHPAVVEIRKAMHSVSFQPAPEEPASAVALRGRVEQAWRLWHTSPNQRTEVGALLPDLLRETHGAVRAHQGTERRMSYAALADLYRLVQRMLAHISEPELYWLALDRARDASEQADDPVSLALGAWTVSIGQRAVGFVDEAVHTAELGMQLVRPLLDSGRSEILAAYGQLHLQAACTHGLDGVSGPAERHLDEAARIAALLPDGYWHAQSAFGTSNVAIYGVSIGVGLRRPGEALLRSEHIDPESIPSLERRSRLLLDIAFGYHQKKEITAAVHYLGEAIAVTPEGVRYVPGARTLAAALERKAVGPLRRAAVELAESIGVAA